MGCGASKAAQVDESSITIKPDDTRKNESSREEVSSQPASLESPVERVSSETSDQALDTRPSSNTVSIHDNSFQKLPPLPSSFQKAIAYEIPLSDNERPLGRMPFPRRLEVRNLLFN